MENRLSYIIVGLFIFVLLLSGVGTVVWLGNYSDEGVFKFYKVATKESVSGLNHKAPVKLHGVPIGEVRTIAINPHNAEEVLITIRIEEAAPIKEDTYALIEAQGITGLSYIQLQGGTNEAKALKTGIHANEYGIIPSRPSTFSRLDKTITSLSQKSEQMLEQATELLNPHNLAHLATILENSAKISHSALKTLEAIEAKNGQIHQVIEQAIAFEKAALEAALGIKMMSHSFTQAIDHTGIETMNRVKEASQSVKTVMGALGEKIEGGTFNIDHIVKEATLPLQKSLEELRLLSIETRGFVEDLSQSPSDLLFKEQHLSPAPHER